MIKISDKTFFRIMGVFALCVMMLMSSMTVYGLSEGAKLDKTVSLHTVDGVDIISTYFVINDYGRPSTYDEFKMLEYKFGEKYAGNTVMVNFTLRDCVLENVYTYWRMSYTIPINASLPNGDVIEKPGDVSTLMRFGTNSIINFTIHNGATNANPYVMIIMVKPMAWNGNIPIFSGIITIKVI